MARRAGAIAPPDDWQAAPSRASFKGTTRVAPSRGVRRLRRFLWNLLPPLTFAAMVALWWGAVEAFSIPAYLLPGPGPVFSRLISDAGMLWTHSQVTLIEILLGFGLTIVTAWELPDAYLDRIELRTHAQDWEEEGRRVIEDVLAPWRASYPDVEVKIRIQHGRAAEVLLAAGRDGDLMVLSRRRHAIPPFGHLGGVAHAILRVSDVPVLVVPFADPREDAAEDVLVLEESGAAVK